MAGQLTLEIVSPEELLFSEAVDMASVPAEEGDIGAMAGHAPMIVSLRAGVVRAHTGGAVTSEFYVLGGFAEITATRCTVVATEAVPAAQATSAWIGDRVRAAEDEYARLALTNDVEAREDAIRRGLLKSLQSD